MNLGVYRLSFSQALLDSYCCGLCIVWALCQINDDDRIGIQAPVRGRIFLGVAGEKVQNTSSSMGASTTKEILSVQAFKMYFQSVTDCYDSEGMVRVCYILSNVTVGF